MNTHKFLVCMLALAVALQLQAIGQTGVSRTLLLKKTEHDVDFYGRVIDQSGKPVPKAEIHYSVSKYVLFGSGRQEDIAITDENGAFEIHKGQGARLYISSITAFGYQWKAEGMYDVHSFEYRTRYNRHKPDPDAPALFHLRRKDAVGTFLLNKGMDIDLTTAMPVKWNGWDIAEGELGEPKYHYGPDDFWDFETTGEFNPEKKEWTLHIRINGDNAGLQPGNELLYEAPAEGYQKELAVTVTCGGDVPCQYIYARLRNPGMYARMTLDKGNSRISEQQCQISWDIFINPYGDRSLEELEWADERFHEYCLCNAAAEKALEKQQLAERPDFAQMLKDGIVIY